MPYIICRGLGKVYTMSPAFRAESSKTRRHLSEFTMLEVEEAFVDSVDQLIDGVEHLCRSVSDHVLNEYQEDFEIVLKTMTPKGFDGHKKLTHTRKYLKLTYDEALEVIRNSSKVDPVVPGQDLGRHHEKFLLDYFEGYPVFVTHYPMAIKPFYMKSSGDRVSQILVSKRANHFVIYLQALNFDLLMRTGGEVCGGSLREDNYEILKHRIEQMNKPGSLEWYLDLRKYGNVPHGGYGIGVDRLIQAVTGVENIREVVPYPRWVHHLSL